MRIVIAAVGNGRGLAAQALYDDYAARLPWPTELKEIEAKRASGPPGAIKSEEGRLILRALPQGATLIALDPRGEALSSEAFAAKLKAWQDGGVKHLGFAIGGADGLDPAVLDAAKFKLSLGAMTWPHLLVRAMLAEQLYRASAIIAGHPYHRG
jgi:23S rRNA (pseudouridine1915-N3)-methyltransferase